MEDNVEIERKFLVSPGFPKTGEKQEIKQGYISTSGGNAVKVDGSNLVFFKNGKELYTQDIGNDGQAILSKISHDADDFLKTDSRHVVRIRTKGQKGYITIKGPSKDIEVPEFEYEIPMSVANNLLGAMTDSYLHKIRYMINHEDHTWEVDVFKNPPGIVVAEIELESKDEEFDKPSWVKEEVTGDPRFFNSEIIKGVGKSKYSYSLRTSSRLYQEVPTAGLPIDSKTTSFFKKHEDLFKAYPNLWLKGVPPAALFYPIYVIS